MDPDSRAILRRNLGTARCCSASVAISAFDELDRREAEVEKIDARAAKLANQVQALRLLAITLANSPKTTLAAACRKTGVDFAQFTQEGGLLGLGDETEPTGGSAA